MDLQLCGARELEFEQLRRMQSRRQGIAVFRSLWPRKLVPLAGAQCFLQPEARRMRRIQSAAELGDVLRALLRLRLQGPVDGLQEFGTVAPLASFLGARLGIFLQHAV